MSEAAAKPPRMTVDEFVAWSEDQSGRYELYDGEVVKMQAERVSHGIVKAGVFTAFRNAIRQAGVACLALPDGMTVRIDARTAFEPDCTIHCGPIDATGIFATNPVIVVEVLSRSSQALDAVTKLDAYFRVASIQHYLIINADKQLVIHHRRNGDEIATRILGRGENTLALDPPGVTVEVGEFFADLPPEEPEAG